MLPVSIPRRPWSQTLFLAWVGRVPHLLNPDLPSSPAPESLAVSLRRLTHALEAEAIQPTSGRVDYQGLRDHPLYAELQALSAHLHTFDLSILRTEAEKRAFWINLYNVLMIHAVIALGVRESIQEVRGVFLRVGYGIGGYFFSPDDIEHGLLRANRGNPYFFAPQFTPQDPRLAFVLKELDPRLHFALVCAADSCPPIGFYAPEKLDAQLELAARNFLNSESGLRLERETRRLWLSRLLLWYGGDFGAGCWAHLGWRDKVALLRAVSVYLDDESDRAFIHAQAERLRLSFLPYSWRLNRV